MVGPRDRIGIGMDLASSTTSSTGNDDNNII